MCIVAACLYDLKNKYHKPTLEMSDSDYENAYVTWNSYYLDFGVYFKKVNSICLTVNDNNGSI